MVFKRIVLDELLLEPIFTDSFWFLLRIEMPEYNTYKISVDITHSIKGNNSVGYVK